MLSSIPSLTLMTSLLSASYSKRNPSMEIMISEQDLASGHGGGQP
jgi:hypothetical protein